MSSFQIPITLHNLRGYDSHLIMETLGKYKNAKPRCIANNMEKYISFSVGNLRFIDSLQFMNASLEKLITNLSKQGLDKFPILKRHYPQHVELLTRKGVYPYDYIDSVDKFEETNLPSPEAFYNKLHDENISPEDYSQAETVWCKMNIKNLGEYHDLYLKTDVLLLADVFENFRKVCLKFYKLDPAHYYTSPGLSMDAAYRMTNARLELVTDYDMYLMIEGSIRGGVSMISKKYAKANNKYLPNFNPSKPSTNIILLDANNLYGWAMRQPLPTGNFKWLTEDQVKDFDVMAIPFDSKTGYFLEVDLDYPEHLHDKHSDYPLAPENITVTNEMLSPYSISLKQSLEIKGSSSRKLTPNLRGKSKYTVHYRALKFYLEQGMVLTKIHRIASFDQCAWLKSYIDFNTNKRKQAESDFEKDFFKLMNNSVYGKTMENMRKRTDIKLVNNEKYMKKLCAKPSFKSFKIFNNDLAAVHMAHGKLILNK